MNHLHFIAGLPRSGSTLLAAILRQNPEIEAGMSSPVGGIFTAVQGAIGRKNEAALFLSDAQKERMLRAVFESYYGSVPTTDDLVDRITDFERVGQSYADDPVRLVEFHKLTSAFHTRLVALMRGKADRRPIVFDTNRLWPSKLPVLARLFPDAKMICMVRDPRWVVDSIERLIRSNPYDLSGIFGFEPGGTVYSRVAGLVSDAGMVGFALNALREAFYGEHADRLVFVEYQALCRDPGRVVRSICRSLGIEPFDHDYEHVETPPLAEEFDRQLGTPGLHRVSAKVEWRERETILPPDLFNGFGVPFWRGQNPRGVPIVHCDDNVTPISEAA
jgi:sulfotransferase